ncbi:MAG: acyl-CoA thioesterase II [Novosphingobium sp.]
MEHEPDPQELVADLVHLLDVEQTGPDQFLGRRKIGGVGRVFGGQVIAQALAAAERTVDELRPAHSLHAYFLRGGSEDHPIDFRIERDFDGGSFSNRRVIASQQGKPILNLLASFQSRAEGVHHASAMPDVAGPDSLETEAGLRLRLPDNLSQTTRNWLLRSRPIEIRPVEPEQWFRLKPSPPVTHYWIRAKSRLPDDARLHRSVLAYASDMGLLRTCMLPHAFDSANQSIRVASLDHALWLHADFRADEWLLYSCDSPWAGNARGFNRGKIYTQDGRLVAEVAQEGMIRVVG